MMLKSQGPKRMSDLGHSPISFEKDKVLPFTKSDASMCGHILNRMGSVSQMWPISTQDGTMTYFCRNLYPF